MSRLKKTSKTPATFCDVRKQFVFTTSDQQRLELKVCGRSSCAPACARQAAHWPDTPAYEAGEPSQPLQTSHRIKTRLQFATFEAGCCAEFGEGQKKKEKKTSLLADPECMHSGCKGSSLLTQASFLPKRP